MSVIDDIIRLLVDRNEVIIKGAITVGLRDGAVKLSADLRTDILEKRDRKLIARMLVPMSAETRVEEMVIPIRIPRQ